MRVESKVHADAAFVRAAVEKQGRNVTLVEQAAERIRRTNGKLLVTLVLIDRARKAAQSQRLRGSAYFLRGR